MVPEIIHIPTPQKLTGNSQQGVGGGVWNVTQGIKIFQRGDRFKRKKKEYILLAGDIIIIAAYIPQ